MFTKHLALVRVPHRDCSATLLSGTLVNTFQHLCNGGVRYHGGPLTTLSARLWLMELSLPMCAQMSAVSGLGTKSQRQQGGTFNP